MEHERKTPTSGGNQTSQTGSNSQAGQTVAAAREQGKQAVEQGKQKAAEVAEEAKMKAGEVADQAKQKATELAEEAKTRAQDEFDSRKSEAASRLGGVASALRQTSHELQNQDEQNIARYTEAAADQVERFSRYIEQKDLNQLISEVRDLAYRQPEMFVAGALAAGFLIGRFFKSSTAGRSYGYDYDNYGGYEYNAGYNANYGPQGSSYYSGDYRQADYRQGGYPQGGYGRYESSRDYGYGSGYGQGSSQGNYGQGNYGQSSYSQSSYGQGSGGERGFEQSGGGNYSSTGTQSAGSSSASGTRTPATPTGSSQTQAGQSQDTGRSNPDDQQGRQGSSGSAGRTQGSQE